MNNNTYFHSLMAFLLAFSLIAYAGCKKSEAPPEDISFKKSESLLEGKNIRKNGSVEIESGDVESTKMQIKEYVSEYKAQFIEENIEVNADSRLILEYRIKIKAEYFSELVDRVTNLGRLLGINIEAEDVSNDLAQQTDRIELLRQRLNQAKKSKNATLIDTLQSKLNSAIHEKADIKRTTLYSYLNVRVFESTKLSHAFSLGFNFGKEGFIWMVKILLIVVISSIPLLVLFIIIKIIIAFVKWRWKQLIHFIEEIGKGKDPKSKSDGSKKER